MIDFVRACCVLALASLVFFSSLCWAVPVPPTPASSGSGSEIELRAFAKAEKTSWMLEGVQRSDTDARDTKTLSFGAYYRLLDAMKVGVFYRRAYGLRHDNDWINPGGAWSWQVTKSRGENILFADATPKIQFKFLPGTNWVGEVKTRYFYNFFNKERSVSIRPGLTYFWLRGDEPFMNFFVQYETDIPLNFSQTSQNEKWLYFGALYQVADFFQIGGVIARHTETWTTSSTFSSLSSNQYSVTDRSVVYSLSAIFQL